MNAADEVCQLDRFDDAARLAVAHAEMVLEEHGGRRLRDLHLLLGVLVAAPDLRRCLRPGLTADHLVACVRLALDDLASGRDDDQDRPVTGDAGAVLDDAAEYADELVQGAVTPAHLLLAMLQRRPSAVADCLRASGISVPTTIDVLSAYARGDRARERRVAHRPWLMSQPCPAS